MLWIVEWRYCCASALRLCDVKVHLARVKTFLLLNFWKNWWRVAQREKLSEKQVVETLQSIVSLCSWQAFLFVRIRCLKGVEIGYWLCWHLSVPSLLTPRSESTKNLTKLYLINKHRPPGCHYTHRKHWYSDRQHHHQFMVEWFWPASWRTGFANAMTSVSSQKGRASIHAKRSTVSQIGNKMIPLNGFSGLAGRKQDYKCDCSLCGGNQDNWTTLSETQKMVKAIILKAQCEAELSATRQPFQRK